MKEEEPLRIPFELLLEIRCLHYETTHERKAVRAIAEKDGRFLMVTNKLGDYKFPGGGLDATERPMDAVSREVLEETGCAFTPSRFLLRTTERRPDIMKDNARFEMTSHYYVGHLEEGRGAQKLEPYEEALGFEPVFMTLSEAFERNRSLLEKKSVINSWVRREMRVMEMLLKMDKI